jgi:hypothetical protein
VEGLAILQSVPEGTCFLRVCTYKIILHLARQAFTTIYEGEQERARIEKGAVFHRAVFRRCQSLLVHFERGGDVSTLSRNFRAEQSLG